MPSQPSGIPPLRVREIDGSPNLIPVFELVLSGATVTKTGPATATIGVAAAAAGIVYAPTGGEYVTWAGNAALTNERILTAGSSVTIVTDATAIYVNALTNAAAASVVYAATGNQYLVLAAAADLTAERVYTASTGLSSVDAGAGAAYSVSVNTDIRDKSLGFFFAGALATTSLAINTRIYIPFNMQLLQVRLAAQTAPTGESIIINPLQYNAALSASTAIFASTNRPLIVATTNVGSDNTTFAIPNLYSGSWLGVNLDQVGSTAAGSNLTITFVVRSS